MYDNDDEPNGGGEMYDNDELSEEDEWSPPKNQGKYRDDTDSKIQFNSKQMIQHFNPRFSNVCFALISDS